MKIILGERINVVEIAVLPGEPDELIEGVAGCLW